LAAKKSSAAIAVVDVNEPLSTASILFLVACLVIVHPFLLAHSQEYVHVNTAAILDQWPLRLSRAKDGPCGRGKMSGSVGRRTEPVKNFRRSVENVRGRRESN
jgi:hypothetical protein